MKKSKRSRCGDRLSKLPDSLIFDIFWLLPIRDVIRTTQLSRRWKDLWKTSPFLNFSDYYGQSAYYRYEGSLETVRNFYNRALLLWRGAKLLKFKVMFRSQLSTSLVSDINVWVRFAKEKDVGELYLDLDCPLIRYDDDIRVEFESMCSCLCSCSALEVLSMKSCLFSIGNGNVKWDRLKSLTIHTDHFTQDMFSQVFRGSPNLEVFILSHGERGGNCYIQSTSLKKLSIDKLFDTEVFERNTEMKIQTPNLETLYISGVPHRKYSLDVSPLIDATLGLHCVGLRCDYEHCLGEKETCDFADIKGALEQILPTVQHVESLTLSGCCLEVLGVMNKKSLLSPFAKVKFLKLNPSNHLMSFSKHSKIAGLLQIFPQLKRLVIEDTYDADKSFEDFGEDDYQYDKALRKFEANLPNSFLLQLRTVEVTWAECDIFIFSLIKTLLKYAIKVEKMVFRVKAFFPPSDPSGSVILASQKLLRMPRSSPIAQLILCKPWCD